MMTADGYYVRKRSKENGIVTEELVHPSQLTKEDIKGMSLADWAVCRSYVVWNLPKHENTTQAVIMNRESINVLGAEMGSGPTPGHPYSSSRTLFEKQPDYTRPQRTITAPEVKYHMAAALDAAQKHALMLKEAKLQQLERRGKEQALSLKKELSKPKEKTYQDYYWEYVDSTDPVKAAEAFANMMDKVTQDQEPAQSSSWVLDRVQTKTVVKKQRFIFHKGPMSNLEVIIAVAIGLQPELWLSLLHLIWGWAI